MGRALGSTVPYCSPMISALGVKRMGGPFFFFFLLFFLVNRRFASSLLAAFRPVFAAQPFTWSCSCNCILCLDAISSEILCTCAIGGQGPALAFMLKLEWRQRFSAQSGLGRLWLFLSSEY